MKLLLIVLFAIPFQLFSQDKDECNKIKDGTFYYYPKNTIDQYILIRDGAKEMDVEIGKKDTSTWKISWSNCVYEEKFVNSNRVLKPEEKQLYKDHKMACKITSVSSSYYTFEMYFDNTKGIALLKDTVWFAAKAKPNNSVLFSLLDNESLLSKEHFSDTSKYAVLYVYRPKKIGQMLINYPVYLDNNLMYVAENNTSGIYKVYREGLINFEAINEVNKSNTSIELKFGKKYYLKCDIHMGIYANPDLQVVSEDKGLVEFGKVKN